MELNKNYSKVLEGLTTLGYDDLDELPHHFKELLSDSITVTEQVLNLPVVIGSIGSDTKDKFGIKKRIEEDAQNPCDLCKYKGDGNITTECNWCLDNNDYSQYYL